VSAPQPGRLDTEASSREKKRIQRAYERYDEQPSERAKRDLSNPGTRRIIAERDAELKRLLAQTGLLPGGNPRVLDVGCAHGYVLAKLIEWGAESTRLNGIDLLPDRVEVARTQCPGARIDVGSADQMPYPDASFELVIASTLFSSILDNAMSKRVASEIVRVLVPNAVVFWFDSRYGNPSNPDVRGISRRRVADLFPGCRLEIRSLTLLPPLARRLGRTTGVLYPLLTLLPPLRARLVGLIFKPSA
jgi:SAM-dependent methyltransferase